MRSARRWILPCLLCFAVHGCSATSERPDRDGASDTVEPKPVPTTITLENTGSEPLVVGNLCNGHFLTLAHDGQPLLYQRGCACPCDDRDACGCPPSCSFTQELVVPGEHTSVEWDGLYGRIDEPGCYVLDALSRGDVVTAEACWNENPQGMAFSCASTDFAYDDEREVTISAEHHSAARTPITIVLENQTGGPIQIVTDQCGLQAWFKLAVPGQDGASLGGSCPCSCNADFGLDPASCPQCGACGEPVVETLQAGVPHVFVWDGMFSYRYQSGCENRYPMPAGFRVPAEVCFTRQGTTTETCQPLSFTLGETADVHAEVR